MGVPPLSFEQVTVGDGTPSVVSLEVPGHRAVCVLGDEASGVGSLGRYALALDRPTTGRVLVLGENLAELPRRAALAFRRRVGYLPAGDGLLQNLTLYDNVALPLRFGSDRSEIDIDGRIQVMLTMLRLQHVAKLRPARVNEEERRRAALARALAFDPELVILEQPFDGLTTRAAAQLLELARGGELAVGARRSVFIVGQSLPEVLKARVELRYRLARGRLEPEN
ncbi:MAG: ATP-binding cassette domain-containing protein [Gemmatimonadetes bacterium]|nr:ATP-binding cassette domain-containing protein [Gemmatimonadota bacterium]